MTLLNWSYHGLGNDVFQWLVHLRGLTCNTHTVVLSHVHSSIIFWWASLATEVAPSAFVFAFSLLFDLF